MNPRPLLLAGLGALALGGLALTAQQANSSGPSVIPEVASHQAEQGLEQALSDPETADAALARLTGANRVAALSKVALHGEDLSARGRALLALQAERGGEIDTTLAQVADDGSQPMLVRTWAASARINRADNLDTLLQLSQQYQYNLPATKRPIELKTTAMVHGASLAEKLQIAAMQPNLAPALAQQILASPAQELVDVMYHHDNDQVRRQAAAYLANKGNKDREEVASAVIKALKYDQATETLPWAGGALYVPQINWNKSQSRDLIGVLIQWNLHCDRLEKTGERQQVQNNLRSVQLLQAAGFKNRWPDVNGPEVLVEYGRLAGKNEVRALLAEQGLLESRWAAALDQLGAR